MPRSSFTLLQCKVVIRDTCQIKQTLWLTSLTTCLWWILINSTWWLSKSNLTISSVSLCRSLAATIISKALLITRIKACMGSPCLLWPVGQLSAHLTHLATSTRWKSAPRKGIQMPSIIDWRRTTIQTIRTSKLMSLTRFPWTESLVERI